MNEGYSLVVSISPIYPSLVLHAVSGHNLKKPKYPKWTLSSMMPISLCFCPDMTPIVPLSIWAVSAYGRCSQSKPSSFSLSFLIESVRYIKKIVPMLDLSSKSKIQEKPKKPTSWMKQNKVFSVESFSSRLTRWQRRKESS